MAAVTAGLAASLGAGYTVAQATLQDASTYVAKGNAVVHANGESHSIDATSPGGLAKNGEDVNIRPLANGKVVAVNQKTGQTTILDGSTLDRTTAIPARTGLTVPPQVVGTKTGGWLLDNSTSSVQQIGGDQAKVRIDGKPVDGAPGPRGSLIVLTDTGGLYEVDTDHSVHELDIPDGDGRNASLTEVGGRSYLVQPGGVVAEVGSGQPINVAKAEGASPAANGRMLVNSPRTGGPHLLVVVAAQVEVVDLGTGEVTMNLAHHAEGHDLGEPVEYEGRVYLPDYTARNVIVLDERTKLKVKQPLSVPGTSKTFMLSVDGGRLWANDQYSNKMIELDAEGKHVINKGNGNGVHGDRPKKPKPPGSSSDTGTPPPNSSPTGGTPKAPVRPNRPPTPAAPPKPKNVTVPDVRVGMDYRDACDLIDRAGLVCTPVAAGDDGGDTDTVKNVQPGPGMVLLEGSQVVVQYYGPRTVPEIPDGATPAEQCKAVEAAGLQCEVAPASDPAPSTAEFGRVAGSFPAAGDEIDSGKTVTVSYYDSFRMPQYSNTNPGTPGASTCQALVALTIQLPDGKTQTLRCTAPDGAKDNNQAVNVGKVYEQTPAAGAVIKAGEPITLTVYPGKHPVADYVNTNGADASAAQTDCLKWFSACDIVQGTVAIGHQQDIGKVEKTDPPASTPVDVGTPVHIYVWNGTTTVPSNLTGDTIDGACQKVEAAGLVCDRTSSHPDGKVFGQALPPGSNSTPGQGQPAQLGSTVVVPNVTLRTIQIFAYPNLNDAKVFAVRPAGNVPAGYSSNGQFVTTGYNIDAHPNWNINEFYCGNCHGHSPNHFVSHGGKGTQANTPWAQSDQSGGPVAGLLGSVSPGSQTCNTAIGQIGIWRKNVDHPGADDPIDFSVVAQNQSPGGRSPEFIGCGWA